MPVAFTLNRKHPQTELAPRPRLPETLKSLWFLVGNGGTDYGDYYWGSYRDYYGDPPLFPTKHQTEEFEVLEHFLERTVQCSSELSFLTARVSGFIVLMVAEGLGFRVLVVGGGLGLKVQEAQDLYGRRTKGLLVCYRLLALAQGLHVSNYVVMPIRPWYPEPRHVQPDA